MDKVGELKRIDNLIVDAEDASERAATYSMDYGFGHLSLRSTPEPLKQKHVNSRTEFQEKPPQSQDTPAVSHWTDHTEKNSSTSTLQKIQRKGKRPIKGNALNKKESGDVNKEQGTNNEQNSTPSNMKKGQSTSLGSIDSDLGTPRTTKAQPETLTESQFKHLMDQMKSTQEWNVITQSMTRLLQVIPKQKKTIENNAHDLLVLLVANAQSLRSTVAKLAIQCIREVHQQSPKHFENDLDMTVTGLLRKIGEGNAFIIDEIDTTMNILCDQFVYTKLILALVSNSDHKNPLVRLRVAVMLDRIISKMIPSQTNKMMQSIRETEKLFPALVHFMREGFADTRNAAKHATYILSRNAEFDRVLNKVLTVSQAHEVRDILRTYASKSNISPAQSIPSLKPTQTQPREKSVAPKSTVLNDKREESEEMSSIFADMSSEGIQFSM